MENQKISVVVPTYNGERTLNRCLNSVLDQTYKDYEVIVVDNNSTDRTKDIIKEFQLIKGEKVKYVFEGYRSRGGARNAGIEAASGEIIAMTDMDCVVPTNWLSELIKPIILEEEMVVVGFEEDLINNYWTKNIQMANWKYVKRNLNGKHTFHIDTKNFAIRASLIKKLMFDPRLGNIEDFDLFVRLRKIANIRFLPSLRVGHNHKNSLVKTAMANFNRGYWAIRVFKKYKSCDLKDCPMTESISVKSFIMFPLCIMSVFTKRSLGEAFFLLVWETAWRAGIIWALISAPWY